MGWEQRGTNRYFYRKEWQDGRCVSTYLGSGETSVLLGECERFRQADEALEREQERRRRADSEAGSKAATDVGRHLRALVAAVLTANDYHQHKGQWRERMERERPRYGDMSPVPEVMLPVQPDPAEVRRGTQALHAALGIKPVGTGKKGEITLKDEAQAQIEIRAAVRKVLDEYPCLWPGIRCLATNARDELLKAAGCARDSVPGMFIERTMKHIENELGYKGSPILERLLIEQVLIAWLDLDIVQVKYAQINKESHTLTSGAYWDRRLNGAQHRYLRAVESLARVRKLALVAPRQVNIGGQQVNVAGSMW